MWAGGEITFIAPLIIDEMVTRTSRIEDVEVKQGRTGRLCFVTVMHEYSSAGKLVVRERQDVVYRDAPSKTGAETGGAAEPRDPAPVGEATRQVTADATMLFRYSAITFNGHRIHYDAPYARQVEGYGGLVVHGPLPATMMAHMAADLRGAHANLQHLALAQLRCLLQQQHWQKQEQALQQQKQSSSPAPVSPILF